MDADSVCSWEAPRQSAPIRGLDALARIRTGTALATAPSRQRVYQFHHQGLEVVTSCEDGTYRRSLTGSSRRWGRCEDR